MQRKRAESRIDVLSSLFCSVLYIIEIRLIIFILLSCAVISCKEKPAKDDDIVPDAPASEIRIKDLAGALLVGDSIQLSYLVLPDTLAIDDLLWETTDASIVRVSRDGMVYALSPGSVRIRLYSVIHGIEDWYAIEVNPVLLSRITIGGAEEVELITVGKSKKLEINYYPANASDKKINWRSGDPAVVTVDQEGIVIGKKNGCTQVEAVHIQRTAVYDHTMILVAESDQKVGASFVRGSDTFQNRFYVKVYLGSDYAALTVSKVELFTSHGYTFSAKELKKTGSVTFSVPQSKAALITEIGVDEPTFNELSYGAMVVIYMQMDGEEYQILINGNQEILEQKK